MSQTEPPSWWSSEDLKYCSGELYFGSRCLREIAEGGTPVYVLRPQRAVENLRKLQKAVPDFSIYYAIKANRHPFIASGLKNAGISGIDVCSPREAELALSYGFRPEQISYTGTSLSRSDLDFLYSVPGIHVNADSLAALRRILAGNSGKKNVRREIGIRINPELGLGYHQESRLVYSGQDQISKFGILHEQIENAIKLADLYGAAITTVHWHVGCGWLSEQLDQAEKVVQRGMEMAEQFPNLQQINMGGGLGVPLAEEDPEMDLADWGQRVRRLNRDRWKMRIEPGAFLVQNSTVLLIEICTVEEKRGTWFLGINSGFNLLIEPVFYGMPSEAVPLRIADPNKSEYPCRFAGNINEAHDMLPQTVNIPLPKEGDFFALLNAGAYGTSMSSHHCLRQCSREFVVD
ncbi:MAG: diaminopimelate decarboxylase [Planctomycetia bacterium]|nr:diaminopimelate decarboxylase [Planctomycetia bacterium]